MSRTILRSTTMLSCAASLAIFVAACAAAPMPVDRAGVSESGPPLATKDTGELDGGQASGMQTLLVKDGEVAQYGECIDANVLMQVNMDDTDFFVPEVDFDGLAEVTSNYDQAGQSAPLYTESVQFKERKAPSASSAHGTQLRWKLRY
ncbi:hypothetical protein [Henriciella litoralis]|uniref:hypothetical protein n=1 Tax=Henriciella litoralis TaxID=568102 RepID=UPI00111C143F|nr:hypothetical protein [Henriciella litoralis]